MKKLSLFSTVMLFCTSCTTLTDSLQLGASLGAMSGAATAYAAQSARSPSPSAESVAIGAGVGLAVGLITAHLVHRSVETDRQSLRFEETEVHFGDLPPSPFIMPKAPLKRGGK